MENDRKKRKTCSFCADHVEYIDYKDADGNLVRKALNAQDAETRMGMSLDEIKEYVTIQSDWNQTNKTRADYIKNKPDLSIYAEKSEIPEAQYSETLTYALLDDGSGYSVTKYAQNLKNPNVVIPMKHNGLPVTSIGNSAFYYCSYVTSIEIPEGVTSIGDMASLPSSSIRRRPGSSPTRWYL